MVNHSRGGGHAVGAVADKSTKVDRDVQHRMCSATDTRKNTSKPNVVPKFSLLYQVDQIMFSDQLELFFHMSQCFISYLL